MLHLQGMQERVAVSVRDLRRRRDPQHSMRSLLEELTHRVGGEFAVATRMISRAAALAQTDEAKSILTAVQHGFENFARVHLALRIPEARTTVDGRTYLRELCEAVSLSRLRYRGISLELLEKKLEIDSEQCWRLGMIVVDLGTNAARRSFVSSPGRIEVTAARRGALIWCRVEDNGVPSEDESGTATCA